MTFRRHHQSAIRAMQTAGHEHSAAPGRPERRMNRRIVNVLALPLLLVLAACGSASQQLGSSVWVTPGKYQFHNCLQAQQADTGFASRQKELEELMTRAEKGPGGAAVNFMVYRTEYQQVLGEREQLAALFQEKRCSIESPRTSERQVF
jgi:hypothetical protein